MQTRKIIHIDMDAFFAAVEQRDHPKYKGKPVVVGGDPTGRGVVSTCCYEARPYGIHSAMPAYRAQKLCPHAIFVRPRFDAYKTVSQQIREIFLQFTDQVEPLSLDEAYLDVSASNLYDGSATQIAIEIKRQIFRTTELTASAGVSYNKFLAKIASDINKPDGIFVIRPTDGPRFIRDLPIGRFHGIGKATETKMQSLGIYHGADLKNRSLQSLTQDFGKSGRYFFDIARGIDQRPVNPSRRSKSIGSELTFRNDIDDTQFMLDELRRLYLEVIEKATRKNLNGRTLTIKVKYNNFEQVTRSITMRNTTELLTHPERLIRYLLEKTDAGYRPVRLLGISLSSLCTTDSDRQPAQMELFETLP